MIHAYFLMTRHKPGSRCIACGQTVLHLMRCPRQCPIGDTRRPRTGWVGCLGPSEGQVIQPTQAPGFHPLMRWSQTVGFPTVQCPLTRPTKQPPQMRGMYGVGTVLVGWVQHLCGRVPIALFVHDRRKRHKPDRRVCEGHGIHWGELKPLPHGVCKSWIVPNQTKKNPANLAVCGAFCMARLAGFEPTTPWFVAKYSIQLSYSR